jgi:catalase
MRIYSRGINHNERTTMTSTQPPPTTDAGIPVPVGPHDPILLHGNFNRERHSKSQPDAKGAGTFGHFEVAPSLTFREV